MANLRVDNLSGSGGRNAIDGSVFFSGKSYLSLASNTDFAMGTGDFTVEYWAYATDYSYAQGGYSQRIFDSNGGQLGIYLTSDGTGLVGSLVSGTDERSTVPPGIGVWNHYALARSGSTLKNFLNGVELDSTTNSGSVASSAAFIIGAKSATEGAFKGYISNFRVIKGTALYTAAFTPPTEKLTAVAGTVLLCCQDSDNALQEATGKTITGYGIHPSEAYDANGEGPELVTSTGVWTLACGGSSCSNFTVTKSGQKLSATTVSSGYVRATYTGLNAGSKYRIKVTLTAGSNNNFAVQGLSADTGYVPSTDGTAGSALQVGPSYVFEWSGASEVQLTGSAWNTLYTFDDVSIKQIPNDDIPKVLPSVGVDEGVVFDGNTKVNTQSYMYFPTGDTSQRGRGRGLFGGGSAGTGNDYTDIVYLNIQSTGNTIQFGDLSSANRTWIQGMGSATRAIWAGGSNSQGNGRTNVIDYVTITSTGNATDFGDALETTGWTGSHSNSTRGLTAGGGPGALNTIGYITIATTGNAQEFGDLSVRRRGVGRMGSPTRAIFAGGYGVPANGVIDVMDYVEIATTGNATDFGNLVTNGRHDSGGCSSGTRGIIAGGQSPSNTNTIQYVTIASTGNTADFGDLPVVQGACGSLDNSIRGVFTGNYNPAQSNVTSFITIASTGNAYDFGDYAQSARYGQGGTSDSHGGL